MSIRILVLCCALAVSFLSARADETFNGSVGLGYTTSDSAVCGQAGGGEGSFDVSCVGGVGYSSHVWGSGDAFSGVLGMEQVSPVSSNGLAPTGTHGSAELQLNEVYVLTGGTGSAVLNFELSPSSWSPSPPDFTCSLSLNGGAQQLCNHGLPDSTFSETVQYNVPFSIDFQLGLTGAAIAGGTTGIVDYSFNAPGLQLAPTPEPSSILLMISGASGVFACARHRLKRRPA